MRVAANITILFISLVVYAQKPQNSRTDVPLRGISAVSSKVAWASGAKGTVLRTIDGGETWETLVIAGADSLDFRDIQAFDQNTAFVLSIGPGDQSRIYKTSDDGQVWQRQFTNSNPKAFYDCFAFWDSTHGIGVSDSVDGKFPLIATEDGMNWNPVAVKKMPAALPSEGAFAA
ncbi:MAG TPA: oxidoreductase, partial [Candidatus Angelobacter sp.]